MAKGSIEKRGELSWRLRIDLGYHPDGTRNRPNETIEIEDPVLMKLSAKCTKLSDAPKKLREYLDDQLASFKSKVVSGEYIKPGMMTFEKFVLDEWHPKYATDEDNLSPSTCISYMQIVNSRLLAQFGRYQINEIKTMQIVTYMKSLSKPGSRLIPKTKRLLTEKQKAKLKEPLTAGAIVFIYRVLDNIFSRAHDWKVIASNPMNGVVKPKEKDARTKRIEQRNNPQFYDEEEAQLVVDALYKETRKWRLMILGSMIGGCRRGELVGLEWPFVETSKNLISIENNIPITSKGVAKEKGPKTSASYRDIDMPEWYMEEMRIYEREWHLDKKYLVNKGKWLGSDRQFVFHNGNGKPYYYQHPSKWWKRFCQRHGLRYIKFHGLRHSTGTLLLEDEDEANFESILMVIQRRLGHARLSTTTDTYVHVSKKVKARTEGKFDKFSRKTAQEEKPEQAKLKRVK